MTPQPGDYGVTKVRSDTGWWIGLGEYLLNTNDAAHHAFLVVDAQTILEAQPGGAVLRKVTEWGSATFFSPPLTAAQRGTIPSVARSLVGLPYGWLDYGSLVLEKFGIRPGFVRRRVNDGSHAICSQLVDMAELRVGFHLFSDGRDPGDVTPGDLEALGVERGWRL